MRQSRNIPALTGIRGLAAIFVVLFHLQFAVARNCWLGVDLFFILSGFILTHVHTELQQPSRETIRTFFVLRFFRIYPLHLATLLAILCLVVAFPGFVAWQRNIPGMESAYSVGGFFQTLTLTNRAGLPDLGEWNGPSWSLSSEALAYAFFPALIVVSARVRRPILLYLFAGSSLAVFCVLMMRGHFGVTRVMLTFPVGVALGRASHLRPLHHASELAIASCLWIALCLSVTEVAPFAVFGFAGLIRALAEDTGIITKALTSRPIMFLGKISFSLYLTHHAVVLFESWLGGSSDFWKFSALLQCLILAAIAYYLIERPSHSLGRIVGARYAPSQSSGVSVGEGGSLQSEIPEAS